MEELRIPFEGQRVERKNNVFAFQSVKFDVM